MEVLSDKEPQVRARAIRMLGLLEDDGDFLEENDSNTIMCMVMDKDSDVAQEAASYAYKSSISRSLSQKLAGKKVAKGSSNPSLVIRRFLECVVMVAGKKNAPFKDASENIVQMLFHSTKMLHDMSLISSILLNEGNLSDNEMLAAVWTIKSCLQIAATGFVLENRCERKLTKAQLKDYTEIHENMTKQLLKVLPPMI